MILFCLIFFFGRKSFEGQKKFLFSYCLLAYYWKYTDFTEKVDVGKISSVITLDRPLFSCSIVIIISLLFRSVVLASRYILTPFTDFINGHQNFLFNPKLKINFHFMDYLVQFFFWNISFLLLFCHYVLLLLLLLLLSPDVAAIENNWSRNFNYC